MGRPSQFVFFEEDCFLPAAAEQSVARVPWCAAGL